MYLDVLQDCKIVSTNELEKMFQLLGSISGSIYRVSCTKSIYVHLQPFQKTLSCCNYFFWVSGCSIAISAVNSGIIMVIWSPNFITNLLEPNIGSRKQFMLF